MESQRPGNKKEEERKEGPLRKEQKFVNKKTKEMAPRAASSSRPSYERKRNKSGRQVPSPVEAAYPPGPPGSLCCVYVVSKCFMCCSFFVCVMCFLASVM